MNPTAGKVLLCRLFEKTSASGNRYFAGRMGAARIVMLLDARSESADPEWQVFVQDGADPPSRPAVHGASTVPNSARQARKVPPESARELLKAAGWNPPEWSADDIARSGAEADQAAKRKPRKTAAQNRRRRAIARKDRSG